MGISLGLVGILVQNDPEKLDLLEGSMAEPTIWATMTRYRVCLLCAGEVALLATPDALLAGGCLRASGWPLCARGRLW